MALVALVAASCPGADTLADSGSSPASRRASCSFGPGDLPAKTLADFPAEDGGLPIDHILLVMQENRAFDHYFSSLTVPGQTVDGAAPAATNPDPERPALPVSRFHQTLVCFDGLDNSWDAVHREIDDGGMDGFAIEEAESGDPSGARALGYYKQDDLPFYYGLAEAFAISDRHFEPVQGPSVPNQLYFMAGTSWGLTSNGVPPQTDDGGNGLPNLFTELDRAGVGWNVYGDDFPREIVLLDTWAANQAHFQPLSRYFQDAQAGALPALSIVESSSFSDFGEDGGTDEEPPSDFQLGQTWVEGVIEALMASPNWPTAALFLTWDEGGGLYDHVPPPPACIPDDWPPQIPDGGVLAQFDHDGVRVPLIVVSPYAKRGYVSHHVTDHASLLRFVASRFGLAALTSRDANAEPPFDMFDFAQSDPSVPELPDAGVAPAQLAACVSAYPR